MPREHIINIINGQGSKELSNNTYTITSSTLGYDDTSILPIEQQVTEGVNEYSFTIAATGTLTLHVTDDGTTTGTPIVGATFVRCDGDGTTYGDSIISNDEGNAVFNAVPFAIGEGAPTIYYKQTDSDGEHEYSDQLQNATLTGQTVTIEIANTASPVRTVNFTDATYSGLPIANGQVIFTEPV